MAYASQSDFINSYTLQEAIELTNIDNAAATTVSEPILTQALEDASSLMDTYFDKKYNLPLLRATPPLVCRRCCGAIARKELDRVRHRGDIIYDFENWMTWLEQIAKGTVSLPDEFKEGGGIVATAGTALAASSPRIDLAGF